MIEQSDTAVLAAARIGDPDSRAELVERCLPVVYNIVGRALPRRADIDDIDDVARDAMLQVLRALPGVRDPRSLRLLLVAEALEQVRRYSQPRHAGSARREDLPDRHDLPDRGGAAVAFEDLDAGRLGLSGEQRELVRAAAWSDVEDRELLSLWWLAESGHLARAELVDALELASHQAAVRVARLKEQLDAARLVERALTASRGCAILFASAAAWDGRPDQRWRVHLAGHVRTCTTCRGAAGYLAPAEQVLDGLAMVAPPTGLAGNIMAGAHDGPSWSSARTTRPPAGGHRATGKRTRHRAGGLLAGSLAGKTMLTAVAGAALLTGYTVLPDVAAPSEGGHKPLAAESFSANQHPGSPSTVPGTPIPADLTTDTAPTGSAPPHTPTTSAPTGAAKTASSTDAKPPTSGSTTTSPAHPTVDPSSQSLTTTSTPPTSPDPSRQGPVDQVLAEINQARAQAGLPPYTLTSGLNTSAGAHTQTMAAGCGLSHQCPGEAELGTRVSQAGVRWGACGENIGEGGPVAVDNTSIGAMAVGLTKSMLAEKPPNDGHRRNILSTSLHHIGISVYRDASGTVWMTQDFSD
ncbi:uncharacterized protein YkwD/DNA-directed RNA polymerase specialized sigma24 family protein [Catenulispora sp. GAS73]|uniref:CAP domain-containing protein n=1 Tax=Catenulispora sp. GAS73 TaxID=3156269 RepID=UPI0035133F26